MNIFNFIIRISNYGKTILICFSLCIKLVVSVFITINKDFFRCIAAIIPGLIIIKIMHNVNISIFNRLSCRKTAYHYNCFVDRKAGCNTQVGYLNNTIHRAFIYFILFTPAVIRFIVYCAFEADKTIAIIKEWIKIKLLEVSLIFCS